MSVPDCTIELHDLLERLVEREFTADDRVRLNALLGQGPAARRYYRNYFRLHSELEIQGGIPPFNPIADGTLGPAAPPVRPPAVAHLCAPSIPGGVVPEQSVAPTEPFGYGLLAYAIGGAVLALGLVVAWIWTSALPPGAPAVARRPAWSVNVTDQPTAPSGGNLRPAETSGLTGSPRGSAADSAPPAAAVALPGGALFSIPSIEPGGDFDLQIESPGLSGGRVLRAKLKAWSDDGPERQPIGLEKLGNHGLAFAVTRRAVASVTKWTGLTRDSRPGANQAPSPINRSGFEFPQTVSTAAVSAEWFKPESQGRQEKPADDLPPLASGCRYTTTAMFWLKDAAPRTAELWCWYFTRHRLSAIRLNGKRLPLATQPANGSAGRLFEVAIREGFARGENRLEVVVDDPQPKVSAAGGPPRFFLVLGGYWIAPGPDPAIEPPRPAGAKADGKSVDSQPNASSRAAAQ